MPRSMTPGPCGPSSSDVHARPGGRPGPRPTTMDALDSDLASASGRLDRLRDLLAHDPLVALARALPPRPRTYAARTPSCRAGSDLVSAAGDGWPSGVGSWRSARPRCRARPAARPLATNTTALSQLVELMATSRTKRGRRRSLRGARQADAGRHPGRLAGAWRACRDADDHQDRHVTARSWTATDGQRATPRDLGWDAPKRYLVLTQDPRRAAPNRGYIGSFGRRVDKGRITERHSRTSSSWTCRGPTRSSDPPGPRRLPPGPEAALASWPMRTGRQTSHQRPGAIRLYANESATRTSDGVLAITTYSIDELLKVTGPVNLPSYGSRSRRARRPSSCSRRFWGAAAGGLDQPQGGPGAIRGPDPRGGSRAATH